MIPKTVQWQVFKGAPHMREDISFLPQQVAGLVHVSESRLASSNLRCNYGR